MRLWSLHPKYLDSIGLVALWRESLLAKKVLENKTKGYNKHPQLIRFRNSKDSLIAINTFLYFIFQESLNRNFNFNKNKINNKKINTNYFIKVNNKQLEYEFTHLLKKLKERSPEDYKKIKDIKNIENNPLFTIIQGPIENWEKPI